MVDPWELMATPAKKQPNSSEAFSNSANYISNLVKSSSRSEEGNSGHQNFSTQYVTYLESVIKSLTAPCTKYIYVAASLVIVTERQTHRMTTITLTYALTQRVKYSIISHY
jgi:hypothetical protein